MVISPASALAGDIKVVVSADLASPSGSSADRKLGLGGGALLYSAFVPGIGLEYGALYIDRKYGSSVVGVETTTSRKAIEIPLLVSLSLPVVSVGAGVYYDLGMGDVSTQIGTAGSVKSTYQSRNEEKNAFGAVLAAGFDFPVAPGLGMVLEARYKFDLSDRDKSSGSLKFNGLQGLAGISLGF